jgi:hypothetical protein
MIDNIALFAETVVEIIVAVIPVAGPLDPPPYLRTVRKLESDFGNVATGI